LKTGIYTTDPEDQQKMSSIKQSRYRSNVSNFGQSDAALADAEANGAEEA